MGRSYSDTVGMWPTAGDAMTDAGFHLGALKLPTWADTLPPVFIVYGTDGKPDPVRQHDGRWAGPGRSPGGELAARWSPVVG